MTDHYHYFEGNRIHHVQSNVVNAIGIEQYRTWKNIKGRMFHVKDAITAVDLMIHLRSELDILDINLGFYRHMEKYWGITDEFLIVYCLLRGVDFDVKRGEFVARMTRQRTVEVFACDPVFMKAASFVIDKYIDMFVPSGHGPTLTMAVSNLHYEMQVAHNKTFIP